ncbi:MAG: formimidoylglutamase, partial [Phenylobacterium sp.]|nr:formimidoylglutamase [Phenylobacterium sp.]
SAVEGACRASDYSAIVNGRFKGGYTTRHYGRPETGVHAIQMELACRGYMDDPADFDPAQWPPAYDPQVAAPMRAVLTRVIQASLDAARQFAGARNTA